MSAKLTWPDILPKPTFDGYGLEPMDAVLRTEMEAGPARQRRRFTHVPTRIAVRWRFSANQMAIFESWFVHKAEAGAVWFEMELLSGQGLVVHEARFFGSGSNPYKAIPYRSGHWLVTSSLEVRERPIMSEGVLDLTLSEDIDALLFAMSSFNILINKRLNL